MNIKDFLLLKTKAAIHCKNYEEAKKLCSAMHDFGATWIGGASYDEITFFEDADKGNGVSYTNYGTWISGKNVYMPYIEFSDLELNKGYVVVVAYGSPKVSTIKSVVFDSFEEAKKWRDGIDKKANPGCIAFIGEASE